MNPANQLSTLRTLRECQSRSVREQQILSGRDWLFVTALVQFLTALYPLYRWMSDQILRETAEARATNDTTVALGMITFTALLLLLWGWAKYAPFRAASVALALYVLLQAAIAAFAPDHILDGGIVTKAIVLLGLIMAVRTGYRRRHSG